MFDFISRTSSDSIKIDTGKQNLAQLFRNLDDIAQLAPNDVAYVKRSTGKWQYAIVMETSNDRENMYIKFLLDNEGHTKVIPATKWAALIRLKRSGSGTLEPHYGLDDFCSAKPNGIRSAPSSPKQAHKRSSWSNGQGHTAGIKPDPPGQPANQLSSETGSAKPIHRRRSMSNYLNQKSASCGEIDFGGNQSSYDDSYLHSRHEVRLSPSEGEEGADNVRSMLMGLQNKQARSTYDGSDPNNLSSVEVVTEVAAKYRPTSSKMQACKRSASCDGLGLGCVDENRRGFGKHKSTSEPVRRRRSTSYVIDPNLCSMIAVAPDTVCGLASTEMHADKMSASCDGLDFGCVDEKDNAYQNPKSTVEPVRRRRSTSHVIDPNLCSMIAVAPDTECSSTKLAQTRRAFSVDSIDSERRSRGDTKQKFKKSVSWNADDSDGASNATWDELDETKSTSGDTQTDAGSFSMFKTFFEEHYESAQIENRPKLPRDVAAHLKNSDKKNSSSWHGLFDNPDHKSTSNQAKTTTRDQDNDEPLSWIGLFEEEFQVATKSHDAKVKDDTGKSNCSKRKERKRRGSSSSHQLAFLSALATIENKMEKSKSTGDLSSL